MTTINRDFLVALVDECNVIDERLRDSGTPAAGKRAIINSLVKEDETDVSSVVSYIADLPSVEKKIAVFNKIVKLIEEANKAAFDAYLTEKSVATPKAAEQSEDEYNKDRENRKKLHDKFLSLKAVWDMVAPPEDQGAVIEGSDIYVTPPGPLLRGGGRGPRKNQMEGFQISINGTKLSADDNRLRYVAATYFPTKIDKDGKVVKASVRDVRDHGVQAMKIEGQELDWDKLPTSFSFKLPNGEIFSASKSVSLVEADDDDDEPDVD